MKAKCIIVDDEPASREILKRYISDIPSLELVKECSDAFEAVETIAAETVDLIFLDINMPGLSGISFVRSLKNPPLIIFTTAYPEYAVEGFDLDAVDYLVKPFSLERFLKAVNRALEKLRTSRNIQASEHSLLIRSDKKIYAVTISNILFVEACGDYVKVVLENGSNLIVHETMKGFTASLPEELFLRVHKSYTVQLKKIEFIDGNTAKIGNASISVSPNLKQELLDKLQKNPPLH